MKIKDDELNKTTFERIADFLPYPFIMAQLKNRTYVHAYFNERFREEIGYTASEIPTIDDWFQKAYPDSVYRLEVASQWYQLLEEAKRDGRTDVRMNVRIATKEKGERWY